MAHSIPGSLVGDDMELSGTDLACDTSKNDAKIGHF